jgi:transcriptional regulator with XRE-family HTH domain
MLHFNCKVHTDSRYILSTLHTQSRLLKITHAELAQHLGVSANTIRNWVKSPDTIPLGMADRWAKYVNLCGVTLRRARMADNATYLELLPEPAAQDVTAMQQGGTYDAARYEAPRAPAIKIRETYL